MNKVVSTDTHLATDLTLSYMPHAIQNIASWIIAAFALFTLLKTVYSIENSIACNDQDEMKQFQTDAKISRSEENVTNLVPGKLEGNLKEELNVFTSKLSSVGGIWSS